MHEEELKDPKIARTQELNEIIRLSGYSKKQISLYLGNCDSYVATIARIGATKYTYERIINAIEEMQKAEIFPQTIQREQSELKKKSWFIKLCEQERWVGATFVRLKIPQHEIALKLKKSKQRISQIIINQGNNPKIHHRVTEIFSKFTNGLNLDEEIIATKTIYKAVTSAQD